jgi:adenylosuccinate lyase
MQHLATRIAEGMVVHPEQMKRNLELTHGALFSQRALTALVESGMKRDDAYRLVQESAQRAWDEGIDFKQLIAEAAPGLDAEAVFDYGAYLEHVPAVIARLDEIG